MRLLTVSVATDEIRPYPYHNYGIMIATVMRVDAVYDLRETISLPISIITREEWELQGCE